MHFLLQLAVINLFIIQLNVPFSFPFFFFAHKSVDKCSTGNFIAKGAGWCLAKRNVYKTFDY